MARKSGCLFVVALSVLFVTESLWAESNVRKRKVGDQEVQSERDEQEALFNYYFRDRDDLKYETRYDKLKTKASLPPWRVPYSASIHPERGGGLASVHVSHSRGLFGGGGSRVSVGSSGVLSKYDYAFNGGRNLANSWEVGRLVTRRTRRGLFGRRWQGREEIDSEEWEGYCSGFTASTIKHPEPVRSVDAGKVGGRAGIVFQPSEIKALLCAIYNRTVSDSYLYLAPPSARDGGPNMGTFHLALTNYIGNAQYPVGIDRTKGRISWNNPIYSYNITSAKDAGARGNIHYKEIVNTITYTFYGSDTSRQTDMESGNRINHKKKSMQLRYWLSMDKDGKIIGGGARNHAGHFLWIPLYAVQALRNQTFPGNPGLDVRKVIALARESALPEVQAKYDAAVIGPTIDPDLVKREKEARELVAKKAREKAAKALAARLAKEKAAKEKAAKEKAAREQAAKALAEKRAKEKRARELAKKKKKAPPAENSDG